MDQYSTLTKELQRACPPLVLREQEPMSRHTTLRIGGPARLMALPGNEEEAACAVRTARRLGIVPFFLGNGSNLLVSDDGYQGFLIKVQDGLDRLSAEGTAIRAGSGVSLSRLANFACERALSGLEFAHGIPGSLGGAVTMNAGAYDGEMRQVVRAVRCLDGQGEYQTLRGEALQFSYRRSAFTDGRYLILSAELQLTPGESADIRARMDALMAKRKSKQPLEYPSAGSAFKRPEGYFAAALIDGCGLKGTRIGGAQVSEKHAGFLINLGGATCSDFLRLADLVRETVLRETGVELELEVRTLGL